VHGYNAVVFALQVWSADVFAGRPSAGPAAVMAMLGVGQLIGPSRPVPPRASRGSGRVPGAGTIVALSATLLPRRER